MQNDASSAAAALAASEAPLPAQLPPPRPRVDTTTGDGSLSDASSPPSPLQGLPRHRMTDGITASTVHTRSSSVLEMHAQHTVQQKHGPRRGTSDGIRDGGAPAFELPHFSTVSLLTVWTVDATGGLFSLVLCDVYADLYPDFPLMFFLTLGAQLNLLAGLFVYLLGREQYGARKYRFYQPFAGGVRFVTLQCFGVLCVAASLLLTAGYGLLFKSDVPHERGFLSVTGALALFGNLLILLSLRCFSFYDRNKAGTPGPSEQAPRTGAALLADGGISTGLRYLRRRPNAESALEVAMLMAQSALSAVAVRFPALQESIFHLNLAITLACGALSMFSVGHRRSLGFVSFRLRMHRTFDTALLWLSRLLYLLTVFANTQLIGHASAHHVSSTSVLAVQGLNVVSCIALLLFVRTIRYEAAATLPDLPSSVFELGGVLAVATVFSLGTLTIGIFFYVQHYPAGLEETIEGTTWTYQGVLVLVSQLAQLVSLLPTPLVYVSGVILHDERFRMLSSNRAVETLPVLLLQAVSYLLYVAAVVSFALFLASGAAAMASLEAVLATLSVFGMTCAVRLYTSMTLHRPPFTAALNEGAAEEGKAAPAPPSKERPPRASAASAAAAPNSASPLLRKGRKVLASALNYAEPSLADAGPMPGLGDTMAEELVSIAYIMNGGMIISYLLCLTNVVLRLLVDISLHHVWGKVELPHMRLIAISNLCFIACVPLAHYSGKDKGVPVFHPFSGSGSFVALQVLGWMTYAMFVIVIIFGTVFVSQANSMPSEWHAVMEQGPVLYTLSGLLELLPVVLITLSIVLEARVTMTAALQQRLAKESFVELRRALRAELAGKSEEEKAVTQLAFETLMRAALHIFDIPCSAGALRLCKEAAAERRRGGHGGDAAGASGSGTGSSDGSEEEGETDEGKGSQVDSDDDSDWTSGEDDLAIRRRRQEGARVIVILLCCASAAFFVIAAFMAQLVVLSLAFSVTAMLICTTSCVGMHAGYGMILHGVKSSYAPFMPFAGGSAFVTRQMAGWSCYTCAFLITLITAIEAAEVSVTAMLIAALLSVVSQVLIFSSVPLFSDHDGGQTFLEVNGEGIVALLTFAGAIAFGRVYGSVVAFFGRDSDHYLHYGTARRTRVPFVLAVMGLSMAVPCTLIALSRTKRQWQLVMRGGGAAEAGARQATRGIKKEQRRTMLASGVANLIEVLVITLGTVTPLTVGFTAFYFSTQYTPWLVQAVEGYLPICLTITALTLALSVVPYVANVGVPPFAVAVRVTVVTWMVYCVPVLAGCTLFLPALLVPRHSTFFLAGATVVVTLVSNFKQMRLVVKLAVYAVIGYLTYQKYVLYLGVGPSWWMARALGVHTLDCLLLGVWLWYIPLYSGKPFHTGSQRSARFTTFARNYLFSDVVRYFNFQVIVDDPAVQMRDGTTQYLFSFHPHGVFPGTALFASMTAEWALRVGINASRYVSTHVASIIFNVPLVRDFNLRLGALSVSRRTLEASLKRGNSVLIVTGGQAEMLHTQMSSTTMTLITQHTGFVRLAIAARVPLVPLLCFAENNVLGLMQFPRIQRIFLKLVGFPFPLLPYGRFGLPVPFRTPLTLVVGKPVPIPADADENNPEDVQRVLNAYFQSLKELFYRRRAEAGYPDMELVLRNEKEEAAKRRQAREASAATEATKKPA